MIPNEKDENENLVLITRYIVPMFERLSTANLEQPSQPSDEFLIGNFVNSINVGEHGTKTDILQNLRSSTSPVVINMK